MNDNHVITTTPAAGTAPVITVVIPAWNRQSTLRRTLDSVEAQTLRPLRVVLVDNASRDSTRAIMEEWAARVSAPDMEVEVVDEPRRGASDARNRGLRCVTTPYVMFFDSDDEMDPSHCADMVATALGHPEADIIGRPVTLSLLSGKVRTGRYTTVKPMFNHLFHGILSTQRYIARTELVRRVGAWHLRSLSWDDWELGVRLLLERPRLALAPGAPTVIVHSQVNSITGTCFSHSPKKWEDTIELIRDSLTGAGRRDLLPWLETRAVVLAAKYHREGAYSEARRLRDVTLARSGTPRRLRLLYLQHRLMGRGTAIAAALLFPFTPRD